MSEIIVFSIGNPGGITRHSCGHLVLKHIMDHFGAKQLEKKLLYSISSMNNLVFVKSNSYMNESDKALNKFEKNHRIPSGLVFIVVYDDFEAPLGRVKISEFKKNESHNGIKSVNRFFHDNYTCYKLGVGIGPKPSNASKDTMASWVLSSFTKEEKEVLENKSIPLAIDYVEYIIEVEGEVGDCNKVNAYFKKNA